MKDKFLKRNLELFKDHQSGKYYGWELSTKYKLSDSRIQQIIASLKQRGYKYQDGKVIINSNLR